MLPRSKPKTSQIHATQSIEASWLKRTLKFGFSLQCSYTCACEASLHVDTWSRHLDIPRGQVTARFAIVSLTGPFLFKKLY